jgi:sugar phosphate isomerase/epimerase
MLRYAVSSWSLDGLLSSQTPLLEIPALLRQHGIGTLEICHFHLPATDTAYLEALHRRLQDAKIELYSILIDAGNIASSDAAQLGTDIAFIEHWMNVAVNLGAERVRIDAGLESPTPEVIAQSAQHLRAFAQIASSSGLRVSTENWHATSQAPKALLEILERCDGTVGLCADTGNAEASEDKYQTLAWLLPRASSVHFKPRYTESGNVDLDDLERCVQLIKAANFDGVLTIIFDHKRDEWRGIARIHDALLKAFDS